jgi:PAS domain S-box-containing protein
MQGVLTDITHHREAVSQARQQSEFLGTILESLTHPFFVIDVEDYSIELANSAARFEGRMGLNTCYALSHNATEPCTSADHPCPIDEIRRTGKPVTLEHVHLNADGEARHVELHGYPLFDENGEVRRIIEYTLDITERKQAEEALRRSEKRYRQLLEALHEGIWVIDQDAYTTFVNPRMAEMLGYEVEEMQGKHLFDFMDERGIEITERNLERRHQGIREQHDFEFLRKDGTRIYTSLETSPIYDELENYVGGIAAIQDITERRQAQVALEKSESLLSETQQLAKVGGWELDLDSQEVRWTEEVYRIHDVPLDFEPNLENALSFYHPGDRPILEQAIADATETGTTWDLELRFITATGKSLWVRAIGRAERQDGIVTRLAGTFQDITERVEAERALLDAIEAAQEARHREEARRQEAEQRRLVAEGLAGVVAALNSNEPLLQVLDQIAVQAQELLENKLVAIYRLDGTTDTLWAQASRGQPDGDADLQLLPHGEQALRQALVGRRPVVVDQASHAPTGQKGTGAEADPPVRPVTSMAVPVMVEDGAYGGMVMCRALAKPFSEEEIGLATVFGSQIALAVESARMREQIEQAAAAAERSRLARDLHDSVSQGLFSASLVAEVLPQVWQRDPAAAQKGLEELRLLTRAALAEMRTLLLELRPKALLETKLENLLEQLTTAITGRTQIEVHQELEPIPALPPAVHETYYRVTQEALNNVVKHAGASRLTVSLRSSPPFSPDRSETWRGQVILQVSDDGQGFDPAGTKPEQLGLAIMDERAQATGATLEVQSHPEDGTQVTLVWRTESPEPEAEPTVATNL